MGDAVIVTRNIESTHNTITCHAWPGELPEWLFGEVERYTLLIVFSTALLSHKTMIFLQDHLLPKSKKAPTTGYSLI